MSGAKAAAYTEGHTDGPRVPNPDALELHSDSVALTLEVAGKFPESLTRLTHQARGRAGGLVGGINRRISMKMNWLADLALCELVGGAYGGE